MSLNWNEIRLRAKAFSDEHKDAEYEKGETQTFYNDFFNIFGIKRRQVARYEEQVKKLNNKTGFIDLFWPKVLLVEQKSAGRGLIKAADQAGEYFDAIKDADKPRFQLLCDFQTFELLDRDTREQWSFTLAELHEKVELFAFMIGREKRKFIDQDPVNIKASEIMGGIHDDLEASGYTGANLERYLVRLLFLLFADDTGIFQPRDLLYDVLESKTNKDGSDLGLWLHRIFEVLDTPEDARNAHLDEDLNRFPYVNGDLFQKALPTADFNSAMRERLLEACQFNWSAVSPAIFGSLFQSVMNPEERRKKGAHYTTEKNIMKVIGPLFLDDLREEFERLKALKSNRASRLQAFQKRLGTLTFLDPACGCGNFLIIAYRELRQLEIEVLEELRRDKQLELDATLLSVVDVDQFYGIEFEEFPARIAEVAMWMIDHIMNNRMSLTFGQIFTRIPLKKSPHIKHADALEFDWNELLPAEQCSFVLGNPPFIGAKYQSPHQRQQVRGIANLGGSGGTLDYVCAWFLKAGEYVQEGKAKIGFVSTNSITQGEQVAQLWPLLFDRYKLEIAFAHRTFEWGSEARGKAHVHVVIVGLTHRDVEPDVKRLFSYENIKGEPEETRHKALTAYLFSAEDASNKYRLVREESQPINGLPKQIIGSKPIDGGYLIFADEIELLSLDLQDGDKGTIVRPFIGGNEYTKGDLRWLICAQETSPVLLKARPKIIERIELVRKYRKGEIPHKTRENQFAKPGSSAYSLRDMPTAFHVTTIPKKAFLVIPEVTSHERDYIPIGWLEPPIVPSNKLKIVPQATLHHFGVLTSCMHMAWMRHIGGRMKSDYSYSTGLVYNPFPLPSITPTQEAQISALAQAVLDARDKFPESTLADLYDPDLMPPVLRKAHQALDRAVDRLYRAKPFDSERERVEHLFMLYEKMVAPVEAAAKAKPKRARKKAIPS